MDNATFHQSKKIKEWIEKKDCTLVCLPPYSPERNPIENYWGVLKKKLNIVGSLWKMFMMSSLWL
jgi:transposase